MNVSYACCKCSRTSRQELDEQKTVLRCGHCGYEQQVPRGAVADGRIRRCVACPSDELFLRKNFSQRLGLTIIVLGFIASSVAWFYYRQYLAFGILLATALLDVLLYALVGNLLECYRCHAEYRGVEALDAYSGFDLETHERHRQQEARLAPARQTAPAASVGPAPPSGPPSGEPRRAADEHETGPAEGRAAGREPRP